MLNLVVRFIHVVMVVMMIFFMVYVRVPLEVVFGLVVRGLGGRCRSKWLNLEANISVIPAVMTVVVAVAMVFLARACVRIIVVVMMSVPMMMSAVVSIAVVIF